MISKELASAWERRNSGEPISLRKLGLQDRAFVITDVDKMYEESHNMNKSFWELFWERYPDSCGCATVSLPGYSRGGTAAVVGIHISRAEYHPVIWITLLAKVEGRWN